MVGYVMQRRKAALECRCRGWRCCIGTDDAAGCRSDASDCFRKSASFKTMTGMILIQVAYNLSFSTLLYRSFISTIPRDLDEAALIDGAKPWQIFFRVILPLLKPVTVTNIVVQSIAIFNDFTNPLYYLPGQRERHRAADAL